jgi:hypothetical protein
MLGNLPHEINSGENNYMCEVVQCNIIDSVR